MESTNTNKTAKAIKDKKRILRRFADLYYHFSNFHMKLIRTLARKRDENIDCNLLMPYAEAIENNTNCFVTYRLVPQKANNLNEFAEYSSNTDELICIIIQGPLQLKKHFTLETIKYYNRIFPGVIVILSTWLGENLDEIERIKNETKCVVKQNVLPNERGAGNTNLQRCSSLEGLKEANRLGAKYCLKTRSDTRITARGMLDFLKEIVNLYPLKDKSSLLNERIVFFNVFLFHPYHEGNIFYFGRTDDLISFFDTEVNIDYIPADIANYYIAEKKSYREIFERPFGELEFMYRFFSKINHKVSCDLDEWWDILSKYTITLPVSLLQSIWYKYDYNHEENNYTWSYRRKIMGGDGIDNTIVSFSMWLDIMNGRFSLNSDDYNYILDMPMT